MKMVMIIVDEAKREELEVFLDRSGLEGYTEVSHAAGLGTSGLRLGSSAYPKTSAVVFSVLTEEALANLNAGVDQFCASCGEELRMVAWDVDVLR
jgi:nitrogen regulatory protein PII